MKPRFFHFTLGPVQGFVAQARRTRDLWAGSFLLSWLAGQAIVEVRRQGGRIIFPVVEANGEITDPLIAAIEKRALTNDPQPQTGSLPNRFKAAVPEDFDARAVEKAVRDAWRTLAEAVWSRFVAAAAAQGHGTRAIWARQVDGFWDISWVLGDDPGNGRDAGWLDARKNWRSRWPQAEGGDHCALLGELQELSGYIRARDRDRQDAFWAILADHTGKLELRENQRLCAIALIKRLFPRLDGQALEDTIGWVPGGQRQAIGNWPSTAYLAAIPWLREFVNDRPRCEALRRYEQQVVAAAGPAVRGERSTHIKSLEPLKGLAWLDGNFFLPNALANTVDTPLQEGQARQSLCDELHELQKEHPAQPYYALLLLDGDSLGQHLSAPDADPGRISQCLARFSRLVAEIVYNHDGVTLYAGGDDVLALLPMDRALDCAKTLREAYGKAFADDAFTASVTIIFAHYHLPLRGVLAEAHRQLDDVAKDGNGRDSIALAWFKASGKAAAWVVAWRDAENASPVGDLQTLVESARGNAFGPGYFYKIRTRYPMLDCASEEPLDALSGIERMLQAEYIKTRERQSSLAQARQEVDHLIQACRQSRRDPRGQFLPSNKLQLDGLRLARLLAGKEAGE